MRRVLAVALLFWVGQTLLSTTLSTTWNISQGRGRIPDIDTLLTRQVGVPNPLAVLEPLRLKVPSMSAKDVEAVLLKTASLELAPRDVRCTRSRRGWDYICTYDTQLPIGRARLQMGIRVSGTEIVQASPSRQLGHQLPQP